MNSNAFYVIYFILTIAVNQKPTFNIEKGCICKMKLMKIKKKKNTKICHVQPTAWFLHVTVKTVCVQDSGFFLSVADY